MRDYLEPELVTSLDQVTAAWVTGMLRRNGLLNARLGAWLRRKGKGVKS